LNPIIKDYLSLHLFTNKITIFSTAFCLPTWGVKKAGKIEGLATYTSHMIRNLTSSWKITYMFVDKKLDINSQINIKSHLPFGKLDYMMLLNTWIAY